MPYQQLRRYLRTPRRIIIDPAQRECDPPEDPNWPAPTVFIEIWELMKRLPHWAQVVCAITAAEMVLPIWEKNDLVRQNLNDEEIEAPRRALEMTSQWLNGDAEIDAVDTAADAAAAAAYDADDANAAAAAAAATAAADVAAAAADADTAKADTAKAGANWAAAARAADAAAWAAAWAAARAADAALHGSTIQFYRDWWALCRCRLAFILEVD